jgi:ABC-type antimicrobial peptide transport system permease subunit
LLLGIFASLALVLAALGIYSVLSYIVRRRVLEIGIRMALGAQISDVLKLIVLQGMMPAAIGVLLGLVGAFAFSRVLSNFVYGISPSDPVTFGAVAIALTTVAFLACLIPGYRATKIEPVTALRQN